MDFCPNCSHWLTPFEGLQEDDWLRSVDGAMKHSEGTLFARVNARKLALSPSSAEIAAWSTGLREMGFIPSVPMGNYVLDFYCPDRCIAIELDGPQHWTDPARFQSDREKDEAVKNLNSLWLKRVLRAPVWMVGPPFWDTVLAAIDNAQLRVGYRWRTDIVCVGGHVLGEEPCTCYRPYTYRSDLDVTVFPPEEERC